jgi:putative ABC transport system permease protein
MPPKSIVPYIVKKYLKFDKSQPFITVAAILSFLGVALGVMVLMVSMAIMNGTSKEFEKKLFTMNYPITILPAMHKESLDSDLVAKLEAKFPNAKFSPYISSQVIIKRGNKLEGGLLFGVDFAKEMLVNDVIKESIQNKNVQKYGLIVGKRMMQELSLIEGVKATLIFTATNPNGLNLMPTMKRFKVDGYFHSGLNAYDKAYMFTTADSLQKVLHYDESRYDGIHMSCDDAMQEIHKVREFLDDGHFVVGWWQQNGNFFSAMELEKRALFIVLMLIILVASLNIISSLLMTVMNRRSEIALLLSLGAYPKEIKKSFFVVGCIIGGGGIFAGVLLGFGSMYLLGHFDIISLPADVYGTAKLPLELSTIDFVSIIIGAIVIVALSSYYPAKKATKINVLQTLRHE